MYVAAPCMRIPDDERQRLQRAVAPLIAASAVRAGHFELARTMARRYADAEPDPVEAARLVEWVEHRAGDAGHTAGACDSELYSFVLD